jgi:RND family efflux transporter MFP subunit
MLKKLYVPAGIIVITLLLVIALSALKPEPKRRPDAKEPRMDITAVAAEPREYPLSIQSQGIIQHKVQSTLSAQVSGEVTLVHDNMRKGSRFKKGDLLIQIDRRDYQVNYELAKANWLKAKSDHEQEIARSKQAIKDWRRLTTNQQPSDLVLRKPQRAAAEAELVSAKVKLNQAELDLERTQIYAPYDGLVLEQHVDIAQFISSGTKIVKIAATDVLEVEISVSAQWRELLTTGQNVSLNRPGQDKTYFAKVVRHTGVIDEQTRQIRLIVEWTPDGNNTTELLAGDYVEASIEARLLERVYVVPRSALVDDNFVWVVRDERIQKQVVNVLWKDKLNVVFNEGVLTDEQINITPLGNVVSGTLVSTQRPSNGRLNADADKPPRKHGDNKVAVKEHGGAQIKDAKISDGQVRGGQ